MLKQKCSDTTIFLYAAEVGSLGEIDSLLFEETESHSQPQSTYVATHALKRVIRPNAHTLASSRDRDGSTALHLAASKGNIEIVGLLLEAGIDVAARNRQGSTALHAALLNAPELSTFPVVHSLLAAKADPLTSDNQGHTSLHILSRRKLRNVDLWNVLIEAVYIKFGSLDDVKASSADSIIHPELRWFVSNSRGLNVSEMFIQAVKDGKESMVRAFLEIGLMPDLKERYSGLSAFSIAISSSLMIVKLLLAHGADPNVQDKYGNTALHIAVMKDVAGDDIVQHLANAKADPIIHREDERSILPTVKAYQSPIRESKDIVSILLNSGRCNVSIKNREGYTALDLAIKCRNEGKLTGQISSLSLSVDVGVRRSFKTGSS